MGVLSFLLDCSPGEIQTPCCTEAQSGSNGKWLISDNNHVSKLKAETILPSLQDESLGKTTASPASHTEIPWTGTWGT